MAAKLLLPGFGGSYVSEVITGTTVGFIAADTIDVSRCGFFAVQLGSGQGSGTIQMQQSFDGQHWANYGSAITLTSNSAITLFDPTDGPFGAQRITTTLTAGTCQVTITGFPLPRSF